jgi:hypothetical protein
MLMLYTILLLGVLAQSIDHCCAGLEDLASRELASDLCDEITNHNEKVGGGDTSICYGGELPAPEALIAKFDHHLPAHDFYRLRTWGMHWGTWQVPFTTVAITTTSGKVVVRVDGLGRCDPTRAYLSVLREYDVPSRSEAEEALSVLLNVLVLDEQTQVRVESNYRKLRAVYSTPYRDLIVTVPWTSKGGFGAPSIRSRHAQR